MSSSKNTGRVLFISAYTPSYHGGAGLCTTAYLQGLEVLYTNEVTYLGPEPLVDVGSVNVEPVPARVTWQKVYQLLIGQSVDRLSPVVDRKKNLFSGARLVFINGERAGRFAPLALRYGVPVTMLFHNFAADYVAESTPSTVFGRLYKRAYLRNAKLGFSNARRITLSEDDYQKYLRWTGEKKSEADLVNGYFSPRYSEEPLDCTPHRDRPCVLLNANLSLRQNQAGVIDFISTAWPLIRATDPQAELLVAGSRPSKAIEDAVSNQAGCKLFPSPTAEEMQHLFAAARVSLCTTGEGSGVKVRVAEALRYGLPIVIAAGCERGYESVVGEGVYIYQNAGEAARHVTALLSSNADAWNQARTVFDRYYSFPSGLERLRRFFSTCNA